MSTESSGGPTRQQSAVLFADVRDYGGLTALDEEEAHRRVGQALERYKSLIGAYRGRVVDTAGDSVFAVFPTPTEAVRFAVAIQREFRDDAVWQVGGQPIRFRIGINYGDILVEGARISGKTVIVAARLQNVAPAGGILLTEAVRSALGPVAEFRFRASDRVLRHPDGLVDLFEVDIVDEGERPVGLPEARPEGACEPARTLEVPRRGASLVMLPLENVSRDPADTHLCEGITADIITNLSRFRDLLIIARHSAFMFRGAEADIGEIAARLGVGYVCAGGLQRADSRIRITVRLIEAAHEEIIWSEHYDGDLADIFNFQDEVTGVIAARLAVQIEMAEHRRSLAQPAADIRAYGLALRGEALAYRFTREANLHARRLFEEAAQIDPDYSRTYAGMAHSYNLAWRYNWLEKPEPALDRAVELAQAAIEHDSLDARGYAELGSAYLYRREHDASISAFERALELNPNDADIIAEMSNTVASDGETQRAIEMMGRAMRLNPYYPDWYLWYLGEFHFDLKDYESAVRILHRMRDKSEAHRLLTSSYAHLGRMEEARQHAAAVLATHPEFTLDHWRVVPADRDPEPRERFIEGLRKAGLE